MNSAKSKTGLKRKHVTLTISNKLQVIEELEKGRSAKEISAEFGISRQTVSDIRNRTAVIKAFAQNFNAPNDTYVSRRKTLRKPKDHALDVALYKWYHQLQANGEVVSSADFEREAIKLSKKLGLRKFTCSPGWLCRFRYRHNIRKNTRASASHPAVDSSMETASLPAPDSNMETTSLKAIDSNMETPSLPAADSNMESSTRKEKDSVLREVVVEEMPIDVVIKEEQQMQDNTVVHEEMTMSAASDESAALKAARDGIDAVITYVGYSSNRELWSLYDKLRIVKEIILDEQQRLQTQQQRFQLQQMTTDFASPENGTGAPASEVSGDFRNGVFVRLH